MIDFQILLIYRLGAVRQSEQQFDPEFGAIKLGRTEIGSNPFSPPTTQPSINQCEQSLFVDCI